ncbi:transmembrane and immunoglobulin domain-containing protein 2 [Suncus etruscus]|uniref:transmembrane and immunoglobulin domain-containing protein 2 n=1 Tax=Suncus etruscus TaxID=109475 RepID=UPI00210FA066|nr:transmembrane and immunoglobulin domain-containing protein 2 [Suncus etruscus]
MGSVGTTLVLLGHLWALYSVTGLSVHQEPKAQKVSPGNTVNLICRVANAQDAEILRVKWTQDKVLLCQSRIINGSSGPTDCGPHRNFSRQSPSTFCLQLKNVSTNDSGNYTCGVTMEIPRLEEVKGSGTHILVEEIVFFSVEDSLTDSPEDSFAVLLVVGIVAAILIVLGAVRCLWSCLCRRGHPGNQRENPLYSNVLYRARHTPKKNEDWPAKGNVLEGAQEDPGFYATSLPRSPKPQQPLGPETCLSPRSKAKHPICGPGPPPGKSAPRGYLDVERGIRTPQNPARIPPPSGRRKIEYLPIFGNVAVAVAEEGSSRLPGIYQAQGLFTSLSP